MPALKFDARAKRVYLAELERTGRLCDANEAAGITYQTAYEHRKSDPIFARAAVEALGRWHSQNPGLAAQERAAGLARYRTRHPERLAELIRQGHEQWRSMNPDRVAEIAQRAGNSARARRRELSTDELRRAWRLMRRKNLSYRRTAHVLGISPGILWRRMAELLAQRRGAPGLAKCGER